MINRDPIDIALNKYLDEQDPDYNEPWATYQEKLQREADDAASTFITEENDDASNKS